MILKNQILTIQFVAAAVCVVYMLIGSRLVAAEIDFAAAYSEGGELVPVADSMEQEFKEEPIGSEVEVDSAPDAEISVPVINAGGKAPIEGKAPVIPAITLRQESRWSLRPFLSGKIPISGDLTADACGDYHGCVLQTDATSFGDIYGGTIGIGLELSYRFQPQWAVAFGISKQNAGGGSERIGTLDGNGEVVGHFDDYSDLGLYVGVRYGERPAEGGWAVQGTALIGVRFVDSINVRLSSGDLDSGEVEAFDSSAILEAEVMVGASYGYTENLWVGAEAGLGVMGGLDGDSSAFDGYGLQGFVDSGAVVTIPARVYVDLVF